MNRELNNQNAGKTPQMEKQKKTARYMPNTSVSGPNAWAKDFSYEYYILLLKTAQKNFQFCMISDAGKLLTTPHEKSLLFLRHDIDISVEDALKMARIEHGLGIHTTYYIRLNTAFYSIDNLQTRQNLMDILEMGHEIGLHHDHTRDSDLVTSCNTLERITNKPVRSISFHIPLPEQMKQGGLTICGRINVYAHELRSWYMADSSGRWWDGEPLPRLEQPEGPILQLVVHPVWWGEKVIPVHKRQMLVQKILEGL